MTIWYRQIQAFKLNFITFWVFLDCQQILKKFHRTTLIKKNNIWLFHSSGHPCDILFDYDLFLSLLSVTFSNNKWKKKPNQNYLFYTIQIFYCHIFPYYLSFVPIFLTKGIISQIYYKFLVMYYYDLWARTCIPFFRVSWQKYSNKDLTSGYKIFHIKKNKVFPFCLLSGESNIYQKVHLCFHFWHLFCSRIENM